MIFILVITAALFYCAGLYDGKRNLMHLISGKPKYGIGPSERVLSRKEQNNIIKMYEKNAGKSGVMWIPDYEKPNYTFDLFRIQKQTEKYKAQAKQLRKDTRELKVWRVVFQVQASCYALNSVVRKNHDAADAFQYLVQCTKELGSNLNQLKHGN